MSRTASTPPGARYLLIVASLIVVLAGLRAASGIIVPFLVAVFVALLSFPLLFWLLSRRVPTGLAVILTIFADLAILAGAVLVVTGSVNQLVREGDKYQRRFQEYQGRVEDFGARLEQRLQGWGVEPPSWFPRIEAGDEPTPSTTTDPGAEPEPLASAISGTPTAASGSEAWWLNLFDFGALVDVANRTLRGVAATLSNTLIVVLITTFILLEAVTFKRKLHAAFGPGAAEHRFERILGDLRNYLGIKTAVSAVTGIVIGVWLTILGIDFAILWGLAAFVLNFIPTLGSIIAAIPTVLLAIVQHGFGTALLVGAGYLVVNMVLGNFVEPQLMGRRLGLSTLVVFLSLVFWGWMFGPVGMLLSVPLTMIVKILLENTEDFRWVAILLGNAESEHLASLRPPRPAEDASEDSETPLDPVQESRPEQA